MADSWSIFLNQKFFFLRTFKIFDDNRDKKLQFEEFKKGMHDYGLGYSKEEVKDLFNCFDRDHSGTIDFEEFLERLTVNHSF